MTVGYSNRVNDVLYVVWHHTIKNGGAENVIVENAAPSLARSRVEKHRSGTTLTAIVM